MRPIPFIAIAFLAILATVAGVTALTDPTSNVKVGSYQGGNKLYVKSGGEIEIQSGGLLTIDGVDVAEASSKKQASAVILDVSGTNSAQATAPVAGIINSIVYTIGGIPGGSNPTGLSAAINGVAITGSSTTFATNAAAYSKKTASPTAAKTVAAGDVISVASDGEAGNAVTGHALFIIDLQ